MTSVLGHNVPNKNVVVVRKDGKDNEVIMIGPNRLEVLEDGSNTDNRIGAIAITIPPKTPGPQQHWHQNDCANIFGACTNVCHLCGEKMHDETFLVTSGEVTFTSREEKVTLKAGDYIVVPPMSPHTFANESDQVATMYNSFTPAYYVNYFRVMAKMAEESPNGMTPEIALESMLRYATLPTKRMGMPW